MRMLTTNFQIASRRGQSVLPAALCVCHAPLLGVIDVYLETLGVVGAPVV